LFSAGRVTTDIEHLKKLASGQIEGGMVRTPQNGMPASSVMAYRPLPNETDPARGALNDADVAYRGTLGSNTGNPYGIPGSQGPAINIGRAARAIRGNEPPAIVAMSRRDDPQYQGEAPGRSVHGRQEQIPGRPFEPSHVSLNTFEIPNRPAELERTDPEWLARHGRGASRYAGGQTEGAGMQNTTRSSQGLDEEPAPTRIPRVWNDGLSAAAGLDQYGFTQQNYRLFLKHVFFSRTSPQATRGIRAVSGVSAPNGPTASRIRIPAIFVPSAVG